MSRRRATPNGKAPESAKVASGEKKGDRGPTANGATASSTDSSATNGDTGAKHDKKDDTAKKDATGKKDATK
jgi:hypothetical protein